MSAESDVHELCEDLSELARAGGLSIAVAESLTAGNLAAHLGRASRAGEWFRGGVVAYSKAVKHSVLRVPPGPVVCEEAARAMVDAVASMMGANLAVALTGEGGPEPQEDVAPGLCGSVLQSMERSAPRNGFSMAIPPRSWTNRSTVPCAFFLRRRPDQPD